MIRSTILAMGALIVVGGAFAARVSGTSTGAQFPVYAGETPTLPSVPYAYEDIGLPDYLDVHEIRQWDTTPADNPITDAGATLGRVLFYDVRLSLNQTVSCATCHRQEHGFSDPGRVSAGFEGRHTTRNSMALAFARFDRNRQFFWDERAQTLEALALEPIQDPIEMGMTLDELTARLASTAFYPALFDDAFGTPEVKPDRVSRALAQFIRSIVASNSRYDAARQAQGGAPGRPLASLTEQENRGLELFFGPGRCEQCHVGDLFMGKQPTGNGLDSTVTDPGSGNGRFKIVSLRNIGLTAPYMHDGRFETLEEVVEHYDSGMHASPALDLRLRGRDGQPLRMNFSAEDREALVAFLHTLSDTTMATDPRWANPFATAATDAGPAPLQFDVIGSIPVRGMATFRLRVDTPAHVTIDVLRPSGGHVVTLLDGVQRGETRVRWDASDVPGGRYTIRVRTGDHVVTRTVTVSDE
ncbi:MAG: cytochrome c peroxidase [Bacteroidota bacterium]